MKNNSPSQNTAMSAIQWVTWADNDYISARQLLLNNLLVQGAAFSNTAIEKYFKAIFIIKGLKVPRTHNIMNLFQTLKGVTALKLNEEYLNLLFKLYRLRYPDDLEVGYNIAINKPKLLVELDYTVETVRSGFDFKEQSKKEVTTALDQRKKDGDPSLTTDNCYFDKADRNELFARNSANYEFRVLDNGTFLEAYYESAGVPDDNKFDVIGLKPGLA
jgi:HEPN domain-containing protein